MNDRSPITTHVLDTAKGRPATGVAVILSVLEQDGSWKEIASGKTDSDGRISDLLPAGELAVGSYQLCFQTGPYLLSQSQQVFYPTVPIVFQVDAPGEHYHVPLLLSPFGYSTYRGS